MGRDGDLRQDIRIGQYEGLEQGYRLGRDIRFKIRLKNSMRFRI